MGKCFFLVWHRMPEIFKPLARFCFFIVSKNNRIVFVVMTKKKKINITHSSVSSLQTGFLFTQNVFSTSTHVLHTHWMKTLWFTFSGYHRGPQSVWAFCPSSPPLRTPPRGRRGIPYVGITGNLFCIYIINIWLGGTGFQISSTGIRYLSLNINRLHYTNMYEVQEFHQSNKSRLVLPTLFPLSSQV